VVRIADDQLGDAEQCLEGTQHLLALVEIGQGTHRHALGARSTDDDLGQPLAGASRTSSTSSLGTSARRMAGHFWPASTVISVTSCLTNSPNSGVPEVAFGAEHGAVERVGLGVEAHRV
jgi:hypothetical protein